MSRNKYPEETRKLILTVSTRLFMTNGYEKTSLQDIINELGGLSKGAIYHHFRSKEDILIAVLDKICYDNNVLMTSIRDDRTLNGLQKLKNMFTASISSSKQSNVKKLFIELPALLNSPTLLTYYIRMIYEEVVPEYVVPIIRQGTKDGSIHCENPEELAEVLMILSDIWLNQLIFYTDDEKLYRKCIVVNQMLKPFGIELFDDTFIRLLQNCWEA